jgi:7-carboxy-7-deazaguanine synthase
MHLKINEIFYSIQGETIRTGFPSVFIRLTGCNLRCHYCDTTAAWDAGDDMSLDEILSQVKKYRGVHHITVTGGEPLLQPNVVLLMERLCDSGYTVQLETNGTLSLRTVPKQVRKIVDVKTPSSGAAESFLMENLNYLAADDELKFVIGTLDDYVFARDFFEKYLEKSEGAINFSPVLGLFSPRKLAELILKDGLPVRLNVQLHKIIWPEGEPKE